MAMNITHQIGALAGTPLTPDSATTTMAAVPETAATTAAIWKTPTPSLKCKIQSQPEPDTKSQPTSPCRSPILSNNTRLDLSLACHALTTEAVVATENETVGERVYRGGERGERKGGGGVPVFVMMPLDSVSMGNTVNRRKAMNASMAALKSAGVEGIMMDVWWGLVERESPGMYNWSGYSELLEMAKRHGLKVQAVMSFHQCGGNVGDSCT